MVRRFGPSTAPTHVACSRRALTSTAPGLVPARRPSLVERSIRRSRWRGGRLRHGRCSRRSGALPTDQREEGGGAPPRRDRLRAIVHRTSSRHDRCEHEGRERVGEQAGGEPRRRQDDQQTTAARPRRDATGTSSRASSRRAARRTAARSPSGRSSGSRGCGGRSRSTASDDGYGLAAHGLGRIGNDDAPEDRQAERDEQQVVVEERRLARDERLELRLRAQQRQPPEDERAARPATTKQMKPRNHGADRALRERVDRVDDARARQERAEERERRTRATTSSMFQTFSIPCFSCIITEWRNAVAGEPRHQRGVLDRIPGVVAAPADLHVGPVRAEQLADAEERPRGERPAARGDDPALVRRAGRAARPSRTRTARSARRSRGRAAAGGACMYGFCRLGFSPAPSAGAACVLNGLATTATSMREERRDDAEHRARPTRSSSRAGLRSSSTAAAPVAGQDEQPEEQRALPVRRRTTRSLYAVGGSRLVCADDVR